MAFLSKYNPYAPGYSYPSNVLDEPVWGAPIVGKYFPRRSISEYLPPQRPAGYELPKNVLDEPLGRGVLVGSYLPRKTIAQFAPTEFLTGREAMSGYGSLGARTKQTANTLSGSSLGSTDAATGFSLGGTGDPIATFGKKSAKAIMANLAKVPVATRKATLHGILDAIDPTLWETVFAKATELHTKEKTPGCVLPAKKALEKALAIEFANHFTGQLVKLGKTGQVPKTGLMGLGCAEGQCTCQKKLQNNLSGMGGLWDTITGAVGDAAKYVGRQAANAGSAAYNASVRYGGAALNQIGDLACSSIGQQGLKYAAGAGGGLLAGPAGASAGATGAGLAAGLCPSKGGGGFNPNAFNQLPGVPPSGFQPAAASGLSTTTMLLIGAGALGAIFLATRK